METAERRWSEECRQMNTIGDRLIHRTILILISTRVQRVLRAICAETVDDAIRERSDELDYDANAIDL